MAIGWTQLLIGIGARLKGADKAAPLADAGAFMSALSDHTATPVVGPEPAHSKIGSASAKTPLQTDAEPKPIDAGDAPVVAGPSIATQSTIAAFVAPLPTAPRVVPFTEPTTVETMKTAPVTGGSAAPVFVTQAPASRIAGTMVVPTAIQLLIPESTPVPFTPVGGLIPRPTTAATQQAASPDEQIPAPSTRVPTEVAHVVYSAIPQSEPQQVHQPVAVAPPGAPGPAAPAAAAAIPEPNPASADIAPEEPSNASQQNERNRGIISRLMERVEVHFNPALRAARTLSGLPEMPRQSDANVPGGQPAAGMPAASASPAESSANDAQAITAPAGTHTEPQSATPVAEATIVPHSPSTPQRPVAVNNTSPRWRNVEANGRQTAPTSSPGERPGTAPTNAGRVPISTQQFPEAPQHPVNVNATRVEAPIANDPVATPPAVTGTQAVPVTQTPSTPQAPASVTSTQVTAPIEADPPQHPVTVAGPQTVPVSQIPSTPQAPAFVTSTQVTAPFEADPAQRPVTVAGPQTVPATSTPSTPQAPSAVTVPSPRWRRSESNSTQTVPAGATPRQRPTAEPTNGGKIEASPEQPPEAAQRPVMVNAAPVEAPVASEPVPTPATVSGVHSVSAAQTPSTPQSPAAVADTHAAPVAPTPVTPQAPAPVDEPTPRWRNAEASDQLPSPVAAASGRRSEPAAVATGRMPTRAAAPSEAPQHPVNVNATRVEAPIAHDPVATPPAATGTQAVPVTQTPSTPQAPASVTSTQVTAPVETDPAQHPVTLAGPQTVPATSTPSTPQTPSAVSEPSPRWRSVDANGTQTVRTDATPRQRPTADPTNGGKIEASPQQPPETPQRPVIVNAAPAETPTSSEPVPAPPAAPTSHTAQAPQTQAIPQAPAPVNDASPRRSGNESSGTSTAPIGSTTARVQRPAAVPAEGAGINSNATRSSEAPLNPIRANASGVEAPVETDSGPTPVTVVEAPAVHAAPPIGNGSARRVTANAASTLTAEDARQADSTQPSTQANAEILGSPVMQDVRFEPSGETVRESATGPSAAASPIPVAPVGFVNAAEIAQAPLGRVPSGRLPEETSVTQAQVPQATAAAPQVDSGSPMNVEQAQFTATQFGSQPANLSSAAVEINQEPASPLGTQTAESARPSNTPGVVPAAESVEPPAIVESPIESTPLSDVRPPIQRPAARGAVPTGANPAQPSSAPRVATIAAPPGVPDAHSAPTDLESQPASAQDQPVPPANLAAPIDTRLGSEASQATSEAPRVETITPQAEPELATAVQPIATPPTVSPAAISTFATEDEPAVVQSVTPNTAVTPAPLPIGKQSKAAQRKQPAAMSADEAIPAENVGSQAKVEQPSAVMAGTAPKPEPAQAEFDALQHHELKAEPEAKAATVTAPASNVVQGAEAARTVAASSSVSVAPLSAVLDAPDISPRRVVDQVIREIRVEVGRGRSEMTIRLDPPELGQVAVRLVSQNGTVNAGFHAESEGVRSVLEAHLPALRTALAEAGITVQSFTVSTGTDFGAFQQRSTEHHSAPRRRESSRRATPAAAQAVEAGRGRRSTSSVDYFA